MKQLDAMADSVVKAIQPYLLRNFGPLVARVKAVEEWRAGFSVVEFKGDRGERGDPGRDAAPVDVPAIVADVVARIPVAKDGRDGRDGSPGKDVDTEHVLGVVLEKVAKALDAIPIPKDGSPGLNGKDGADGIHGKDGSPGLNGKDGADGVHGKDGAPGLNGKDGTPGDRGEKGDVGAAGSDGLDGKDGAAGSDGKDGAPGTPGERGEQGEKGIQGDRGADGVQGKDGANGLDGKDGAPGIQGKDGAPGLHGKDGDPGQQGLPGIAGVDGKSVDVEDLRPLFESKMAGWQLEFERNATDIMLRAMERLPKAKDGAPGRDGMTLEGFDAKIMEDGRTVVISLRSGDLVVTKDLRLSIPIWRGVYKSGRFEKDDIVTWGGSGWIALQDTEESPGGESKHWRLSIKKGSNGRDATPT